MDDLEDRNRFDQHPVEARLRDLSPGYLVGPGDVCDQAQLAPVHFAQPPCQFERIDVRHAEIENDRVRLTARNLRRSSGTGNLDDVAESTKKRGHGVGEVAIAFDDQNGRH